MIFQMMKTNGFSVCIDEKNLYVIENQLLKFLVLKNSMYGW